MEGKIIIEWEANKKTRQIRVDRASLGKLTGSTGLWLLSQVVQKLAYDTNQQVCKLVWKEKKHGLAKSK